ncbi:hypothetical protein LTR59_018032, partial [Friedmanniomyces endolithicus]
MTWAGDQVGLWVSKCVQYENVNSDLASQPIASHKRLRVTQPQQHYTAQRRVAERISEREVDDQEVKGGQEVDKVLRDPAAAHKQWCQPRRSWDMIRMACRTIIRRRKPDVLERRELRPTLARAHPKDLVAR